MKERIALNLNTIGCRIKEAAERVNRSAEGVTLVAVTKSVGLDEILALYELGIRDFGENRLDVALEKIKQCPSDIRWHYLAPVQTRKARDIAARFTVADAVDRVRAAEVLQKRCEELDCHLEILVEVNVSGEESKHGFDESLLSEAVERIRRMDRLSLQGLMTMAPWEAEEKVLRRCFAGLKKLCVAHNLPVCSMGMTDDFEIAIEEGSTQVRIGRALFV
ncbi:MAG TPA: YggS family pyridoxal phosphate-dependent enzyme [Candidatus Hydrogenedentes bacterium]|nr:MAG: hypothetical protein BWY07_00384 [Candidatus Hydrogenedentes bacterium ADurb.Bin170]HQB01972.1 YggS family pyridoxal phosphate-dependent enzyme [Candidatus Hydrogenedentota bacterium]